jgi:glycine cleavage system aminomethyltransferase T
VSFDKADLRGRAGLERDREGTELRLTSVVLESGGDDASGAPLSVGGFITQAVVSPFLGGKTLGLAKVPAALAKAAGSPLTATVGGEEIAGEIAPHPVYDKERKRAKEL